MMSPSLYWRTLHHLRPVMTRRLAIIQELHCSRSGCLFSRRLRGLDVLDKLSVVLVMVSDLC